MGIATFALGALAVPVFKLGFVDALLTIFFINLLGVIPVCFFSTFGPEFGLRQIIVSRFFFGYYGVKLGEAASSTRWRASANVCHQLPFSTVLLVLAGPQSMRLWELNSSAPSTLAYQDGVQSSPWPPEP